MHARTPNGTKVSISSTYWEIVRMSDAIILRQLVYYDGPKAYPQDRYHVARENETPIEMPTYATARALFVGFCVARLHDVTRDDYQVVSPLEIKKEAR